MKRSLVIVASALLLTGCCSTHLASQQWEYKVASTPVGAAGTIPVDAGLKEQFLNKLAMEGWLLVAVDGELLYLKRARK
jgi:PBP1b-binding outer membrane lipoprotein LpoB